MSSDGKMENAKLGASQALELLGERDIATVVVYDSEASVLVAPQSAGNSNIFRRAISRIEAGGNTALFDGVSTGARELERYVGEGYIPRIILLSDGLANVGPSSAQALGDLGRSLAGRDMTITTIGLGLEYNEDLMTELAAQSGGNSYFAKSSRSLAEIFAADLEDAVAITGRHVRLRITCGDGVKPIRAVGRRGEVRGQSLEAYIDNLYGDEKYALFEIEVPSGHDGYELIVGSVEAEYVDAVTDTAVTLASAVNVVYTRDENAVAVNRDSEISAQAELAKNAEIREEAVRLADEGRSVEASEMLKERTEYLRSAAPASGAGADAIQEEAEYFDSLAQDLEEKGEMSSEQRKENINSAYRTKNQQSGHD
jgi:Ca-activated chloride channel family protein